MLGFKEYRNRLTEATPDVETGVQPEYVLKHERAANIQKQVNQIVDAWVSDLKRTLMNPMTPLAQRRGVWDRFKNTMSNMWHGRYNQTNPYFWQNKLGDDLGATQESFNPNSLSLADYKSLRDICESLEEQLNEDVPAGAENLRLVRMIDTKAQELKQKLMSIVGGAEDSSPMSAAASMGTPEVPAASMGTPEEPASAAPQEEEQDSKVPGGFLDLVKVVEGWAKSKKMDIKTAQDLIDRLKSKKNSIRQKAADDWERFEKAPVSGPSASPDAASPDAASPDAASPADSEHGMFFTPPTTGKKWSELTPDEMKRWNRYGGGQAHQGSSKIDGCLDKDHGIKNMPWILRIGDPRREILDAQENKKLPISKNCAGAKSGSHWHREMHKSDRWEHHESPIKSVSELLARVEKAKAATEQARRRMPRSTAPSDVDAARDAAMAGGETEAPKTAPMVDPAPTMPTPEPAKHTARRVYRDRNGALLLAKPSLRGRVGSIGDEVPEVKKFTGDGSGLSEPMHKGDDTPTDAPPDPKTRVAGMDGAEAIPNPTPEEKPVRQKGLKGRIKTLSGEKTRLRDRIEVLSNGKTKEALLEKLDKIKDRADLAALENDLVEAENVHTSYKKHANVEFEWTVTDLKNFYKQRLHERKGVPQPLVEQKKIEMLSFTERTQYFKEQLQKRR